MHSGSFISIRVISPSKRRRFETGADSSSSNPNSASDNEKASNNNSIDSNLPMTYAEVYGNFMSHLASPSFKGMDNKDAVIYHENLCLYLDIIRGRQKSFDSSRSIYSICKAFNGRNSELSEFLRPVIWQILNALAYIHSNAHLKAHGNIQPKNIFLTEEGLVKLSNYGLLSMTGDGKFADFPFGEIPFLSPEYVKSGVIDEKGDVFVLGLSLLELLNPFSAELLETMSERDFIRDLYRFFDLSTPNNTRQMLNSKLAEANDWDNQIIDLIESCLKPCDQRKSCQEMLNLPWLKKFQVGKQPLKISSLQGSDFSPYNLEAFLKNRLPKDVAKNPLDKIPIEILCFFWKIAGGDAEVEWKKNTNHLVLPPCMLLIPKSIVSEPFAELGSDIDVGHLYCNLEIKVSMETLNSRISSGFVETKAEGRKEELFMDEDYINVESTGNFVNFLRESDSVPSSVKKEEHKIVKSISHDSLVIYSMSPTDDRTIKMYLRKLAKLPLKVKEQDIDYQYHRILLFQRLLEAFPHSIGEIVEESKVDIPPYFRGIVWAVILGVFKEERGFFLDHDNWKSLAWSPEECPDIVTSRQIDVDVPRCHQYHPLLSSPQGHEKLKIILKTWVTINPNLAYWQGLDSVAAPFVIVNFSAIERAFFCLQNFVSRFLDGLYQKENSAVLQDYLAILSHLIMFHDPVLGMHMLKISFTANLFAIPWFLTLFTHVFPMDRVLHFWDKLLVSPPGLSFFIGLSIVLKVREILLTSDFNDCIMMFSDVPEVDIDSCLVHASHLMKITPPSIYLIRHNSKKQNSDFPLEVGLRRSEKVPRILFEDLCRMANSSLILDTRSETLFLQCHFANSFHWNSKSFSASDYVKYLGKPMKFTKSAVLETTENDHDGDEDALSEEHVVKYVIVLGVDVNVCLEACEKLLELNIPFVCTLHGQFPPSMTDWKFFEQICYCQCHSNPLVCTNVKIKI